MSTSQRNVVLIEPHAHDQQIRMAEKLRETQIKVCDESKSLDGLIEKVSALKPDILILAIPLLDHQMLVALESVNKANPLPVLVVADQHAKEPFEAIVGAGISSYVVDDVSAHRLPLIIELAIERFHQMHSLYLELNATKEKLSERKLIEKAKGILMEQKKLSEADAYAQMRSLAMNQGKTMRDLSSQIISVVELFE